MGQWRGITNRATRGKMGAENVPKNWQANMLMVLDSRVAAC